MSNEGYVRESGQGFVRPVVTFTRADHVAFKDTDWLLRNWLVRNTLAGLVGPSGSCKTFLALDWACRIATGSHWLGNEAKRGGVFYLAGEGQAGLRKRIRAWETYHETSLDGAPLYLANTLPFLVEDSQALGTLDAIEALSDELLFENGGAEPALIVVDTLARAMGGANENSAQDMGALVRSMDWLRSRFEACVLSVHHTGHAEGGRARGSSAFFAALDSEFQIRPDDGRYRLTATKTKDWKAPTPLSLQARAVEIQLESGQRESSLILHSDLSAVIDQQKRREVAKLAIAGETIRHISEVTGVARSTVSRWLKEDGHGLE